MPPPDAEAAAILAEATPDERSEILRQARFACWLSGDLTWKLDANQQEIRQRFRESSGGRFILECGRRVGKTWFLCVEAIEVCLSKPRARVAYGAQTLKEVTEFVIPTIEAICEDAPPECKPLHDATTGHYEFPNGSVIALFGCDDKKKADRGRGPGADLCIVDEAGFISILKYVVKSVLRPQTLTTGGRMLIGSSPAEEPGHDFTELCELAEATGNLINRTIYDNPRLSKERIAEYIAEDAKDEGLSVEEYQKTDTFKREYLAQRVVERTLVVMGDDWMAVRDSAMVAIERPQFFDAYVSLDMGGVDPHAVLFGYWHFERSTLVIEDELLLREGENTADLQAAIKDKERELWGVDTYAGTLRAAKEIQDLPDWLQEAAASDAPAQPYLRICDSPTNIARDLQQLHRITFLPTAKDDKRWQINEVRVMLRQGRIKIHPRCHNLDRHLRTTVWANHRQADFKRKGGEHGDLVDCLAYVTRNLRKSKNPTPPNWGVSRDDMYVKPRPPHPLKQAFGLTRRRA